MAGGVSHGRMIGAAEAPPPSNVPSEERAVRDMAESETECSEGLDEAVLGRLASLPLDPFPPRDFRGKFKKMRHKKRPTILECKVPRRCHTRVSLVLLFAREKRAFVLFVSAESLVAAVTL